MTLLAAILAGRGIAQYELRRRTLLSPQTVSNAPPRRRLDIAKALDGKLAVFDPGTGDEFARDRRRSDALTGNRGPAGRDHVRIGLRLRADMTRGQVCPWWPESD